MELVYADDDILVCLKPPRVLSTDEPGGVPDLAREALGNPKADVRTVHRLDRVVSGLMVLAGSGAAALLAAGKGSGRLYRRSRHR
jgi:23S rRNA-/tRNA-specific pseudouridylate synthase